ncbi:hypothetical protein GE09DRAFT_1215398 [Coniochaeta sp. 2T2.1]|nr:hypothetical protein GE09DRAFT_1215398 [Coniochaeta sp. 2T2.1]
MPSLTPQQPRLFEVAGFSPMWVPGSPWHDYRLGFGGDWHPHTEGRLYIAPEIYHRRNPRPWRGLTGSAPGLLESHPFRELLFVRTDGAYSFPRDRYYDDDSDYYDDDDSDDIRRDENRDALARRAVAHMIWGTIPYGTGQALSPTGYGSANGAQDGTGGRAPNGSGTDPMDNSTGGGPPNRIREGDGRNGHAGHHHDGAAPHINAARHNNRTTQHVPRQQPPWRRVTAESSASREPYGYDQHSGRAYRLRRALSAPLQGVLEDFFARDRPVRANSPVAGSHASVGSHAADKHPSKVGSSGTKPQGRHQDAAVEQERAVSIPHGEREPADAITPGEGSSRQTKDLKGKMKDLSLDSAAQPPTKKHSFEPFPSYNEPEGWRSRSSTAVPAASSQQQPITHANARIDGPSSSVSTPTDAINHAPGSSLGTQGGGPQKKTPAVPPRLETSPWVKDLHDDNQTDPSTTGSTARPSWRKRTAQSIRRLLPHMGTKTDHPDFDKSGGGVNGLWRRLRNQRRSREQRQQQARLAEEIEMWRRRDKKNQETTVQIEAVGEEETVRPRANGAAVRPAPPAFVPKQKKAKKAKSPKGQQPHHHHHRTPHQAAHDFFDEEAGREKAKKAFETAPLAGAATTVMMAAS